MLVRTVVFDVDGTVADSMPFLAEGIRVFAGRLGGRTFTTQEVVDAFGPPDLDVIANLIGRPLTGDEVAGYIEHLREHVADAVPPIPGMTGLLAGLRDAGISLGVYSARSLEAGMVVLRGLGIDSYFDAIVAGDLVANPKPHPEGLFVAMRRLGAEPATTLYVGDTSHDLQVARAAGVASALVLWARDPRSHLVDEADHHFWDVPTFRSWVLERA
jgi:HAD superfamily hydrolase (TIGR01509 family)